MTITIRLLGRGEQSERVTTNWMCLQSSWTLYTENDDDEDDDDDDDDDDDEDDDDEDDDDAGNDE